MLLEFTHPSERAELSLTMVCALYRPCAILLGKMKVVENQAVRASRALAFLAEELETTREEYRGRWTISE